MQSGRSRSGTLDLSNSVVSSERIQTYNRRRLPQMAQTVPILCLDGASDISPQEDRELTVLAHEVLASLNATGVAIAIEDGDRIVCRARAGTSAPEIGTFLDHNSGISARCIREDASLAVYDTDLDARVNCDACRRLGIRSLAVAPLHHASRVTGFIEVFSNFPSSFDQECLRRLEAYAAHASAIRHRELPAARDFALEDQHLEDRSGKPICPPEFIGAPNSETKPSHWKWALVVAAFITLILVGFWFYGPMRGIARIAEQLFSSAPAISQAKAEPPDSPAKSSSLTSLQVSEAPAAVAPAVAALGKDALSTRSTEVRQRADSGDPETQLILPNDYGGNGTEKDLVKAAASYIVAGIGGNVQARQTATELTGKLSALQIAQIRFQVAEMFRDGTGVPPDLEIAYSWFALAQAAGDRRAEAEEKKLGTVMRPEEITEARNRAASWIAAHRRKSVH